MDAMHPTNEKGLSAPATQTQAMQTEMQFRASVPVLQKPLEQHFKPMTERQLRLSGLLLIGPASREHLDRHVGCSNGPDEVRRFRHKYGLEIPCDDVDGIDRDGHKITHGIYSLTPADREKLEGILLALAESASLTKAPQTHLTHLTHQNGPKSIADHTETTALTALTALNGGAAC